MKSLESIIPSHLAAAVGETFMHSLWQLVAITGLLIVAFLFVHRKNARLRYRMGIGALSLMLLLPIGTFFFLYEPASDPVAGTAAATFAIDEIGFLPVVTAEATLFETITAFFNQYAYLIFGLWCIGAGFFALRFAGGFYQVQRLRRRQTLAIPAELQAVADRLSDRLGIRRNVTIRQSRLIDTPLVVGVFKPMVLLPMGLLSGLSSEQVECILTHELAHIRRADYLVNILQSMAEIILFFHPAVWWVSKMVREERENACDQVVVDLKENRMVYAHALLNLEVIRSQRPQLAMGANGGKLLHRIQRITGGEAREKRPYTRGLFLGLFSLLMIVLLTTTNKEQIQASMPFLNELPPELQFVADQTSEDPFSESASTNSSSSKSEAPLTVSLDGKVVDMAGLPDRRDEITHYVNLAGDIDYEQFGAALPTTAQDSPVKKIVIVEDGEEVAISFDKQGEISEIMKNGRAVPQSDYAAYESEIKGILRTHARRSGHGSGHVPPVPPMPRVGSIPPMPPMPALNLQGMPAPPAPPADMENDKAARKRYEKEMEAYEEEMEAWGERIEEQFEDGEWADYEVQMEVWGEELEAAMENGDWERFGEEMEEWGEAFGKEIEMRFSGESDGSALSEEYWEEFGERMEEMGEEIAAQFGGKEWESFGEEMEALGQKIEREMEVVSREVEREVERAEREMERAERDRDRVYEERRTVERAESRGRMAGGVDALRRELDRDGIVEMDESFRLKINEDELYIDGDKQARPIHEKYVRMLERGMDIPVDSDDFIEINFKKRRSSESLEIER